MVVSLTLLQSILPSLKVHQSILMISFMVGVPQCALYHSNLSTTMIILNPSTRIVPLMMVTTMECVLQNDLYYSSPLTTVIISPDRLIPMTLIITIVPFLEMPVMMSMVLLVMVQMLMIIFSRLVMVMSILQSILMMILMIRFVCRW